MAVSITTPGSGLPPANEKVVMERVLQMLGEQTQKSHNLMQSLDVLKHRMNELSGMVGRASAALVLLAGLPTVMRGGLLYSMRAGSGGGGAKGGGKVGGGGGSEGGNGDFPGWDSVRKEMLETAALKEGLRQLHKEKAAEDDEEWAKKKEQIAKERAARIELQRAMRQEKENNHTQDEGYFNEVQARMEKNHERKIERINEIADLLNDLRNPSPTPADSPDPG